MRLGMSSAAFYGVDSTERLVERLQDYPLDTCEVFLQTFSEYGAAFGREVRAHLGKLDCASVHPLGAQFETQLFADDARQREDALAVFESVCASGEQLGARYYVLHGPFRVRGEMRLCAVRHLEETVHRLECVSACHGMQPLWENVSWCALRTPEDVRYLRERLPAIGFVLDVKQATECGIAPDAMAEAMGEGLKHLHVLDCAANGTLCLPGEGCVDWAALREALRRVGFDGAVVLEPYAYLAGDEQRLRRSLRFLRQWMREEGAEL